jgi:hypothetical protein
VSIGELVVVHGSQQSERDERVGAHGLRPSRCANDWSSGERGGRGRMLLDRSSHRRLIRCSMSCVGTVELEGRHDDTVD